MSGKQTKITWRFVSISLACTQNLMMGGLIFGWTSISSSLLLSNPSDGGPGLTRDYVNIMFVIASFFSFLGPLLLGIVLDMCGPRICSIVSIGCIVGGLGLFGISSVENNPFFIPGMCLIAFGGPGVQNAIIHVSNLFPKWKSLATAIITGCFQLSFSVFYIFDKLWFSHHWDYQTLFIGYAMVCFLNIFASMYMWPDKPYTFEAQSEVAERHNSVATEPMSLAHIRLPSVMYKQKSTNKSPVIGGHRSLALAEREQAPLAPGPSLRAQLTSPEFLQLTAYVIVSTFWANFYIGTVDLQLGDMHSFSPEASSAYGSLFTLVMSLGIFAIPVVGFSMDIMGFPATSLITNTFGLCWAILLLQSTKTTYLASFVMYTLFRTFLFTFFFAYLADTLGFEYFGVLAGVVFASSGVVGLLQYPLTKWATGDCHLANADAFHCDRGRWDTVNLGMMLSFVFLFSFSYSDWVRRRNSFRKGGSPRRSAASDDQAEISLLTMKRGNGSREKYGTANV